MIACQGNIESWEKVLKLGPDWWAPVLPVSKMNLRDLAQTHLVLTDVMYFHKQARLFIFSLGLFVASSALGLLF